MKVAIIGAAVDLGADRRGVDMGASAIRYADLEARLREAEHDVRDLGNVEVPVPESLAEGPTNAKYLEPIARMAERLADRVGDAIAEGYLPLILGGDHSVSLGSVSGVTRHHRVGVLWVDAHGDFNTPETSGS